MNDIKKATQGDRSYVITTDGGSYVIMLLEHGMLVESKFFNEHTLRIVQDYADKWLNAA